MEAFPCLLERTVASALLLLAVEPPSLSPPASKGDSNGSEKTLALSNSKSDSCSSTVIRDDDSSAETRTHPLRMVAVVAPCHEMKLKVVRKSRSKIVRRSDYQKVKSGQKSAAEVSVTAEASSCLSSSSIGVVSGARSGGWKKEILATNFKPKPPVSSASLSRRAEGIMRLLSYGCTSEVRIRQLLGDSPDTSKALRMLLKKQEIKRSGAGGRGDPYIYKIA